METDGCPHRGSLGWAMRVGSRGFVRRIEETGIFPVKGTSDRLHGRVKLQPLSSACNAQMRIPPSSGPRPWPLAWFTVKPIATEIQSPKLTETKLIYIAFQVSARFQCPTLTDFFLTRFSRKTTELFIQSNLTEFQSLWFSSDR